VQEVAETRDAIIEDDNRSLDEILQRHKGKKDPYWIVLFAKPSKRRVDGKPTLFKYFKPHTTKPSAQVGMVIGEVDNSRGTIRWEVNMPDAPFGYQVLGLEAAGAMEQETSIPEAYRYN
jgi:hypothetical protein